MSLYSALLAVQQSAPSLQKNSINPHFKNRYISLDSLMEQILPVLNSNGLLLLQLPTTVGGEPALRTSIVHEETGESIEDTMLLVLAKDDPQGQGSAITYARRYALMAALGLVADEDDDAEAATKKSRGVPKSKAARAASAAIYPIADDDGDGW